MVLLIIDQLTALNHSQGYVVIASKSGLAKGMGEIKDQFLAHAHPPQQVWMHSTTSLDIFGFSIASDGIFGQVL